MYSDSVCEHFVWNGILNLCLKSGIFMKYWWDSESYTQFLGGVGPLGKFVILQSMVIIVIESKETRVGAHTSRYTPVL